MSTADSVLGDPVEFVSGAKRGEMKPRYHLVPKVLIERTAKRFEIGAIRYGEYNWQLGLDDIDFMRQVECHAMDHLLLYMEGDRSDDHLAAIAWAMSVLMTRDLYEALRRDQTEPQLGAQTRTVDVQRPVPQGVDSGSGTGPAPSGRTLANVSRGNRKGATR